MRHLRPLTGTVLAAASLAACLSTPTAPGPHVALNIAPLSLPGVQDAEYRVTVANHTGDIVWTRDLSAGRYTSAPRLLAK